MMQHSHELWDKLKAADLVSCDAPKPKELESPWYVKVLLGFSGWIASFFLLGFLGLGFDIFSDNSLMMNSVGLMMVGGSYVLLQLPKNEFIEHMALAGSLAGQLLIIIALFDLVNNKDDTAWFLFALIQAALTYFMPNLLHRFFSSFAAAFCMSLALAPYGLGHIYTSLMMLGVVWLWLHEFSYPQHIRKIRTIAYGVTIALIQLKGSFLFGSAALGFQSIRKHNEIWAQPWVGEVLAGAVLFYLVWQLLKRNGLNPTDQLGIFALFSSMLVTAVSFEAHGIVVGIMIILLGFSVSNLVLQGLGIISLLLYISAYYYLLQTTLLDKSQTLLLLGVALLVIRWLFIHLTATSMENHHAK